MSSGKVSVVTEGKGTPLSVEHFKAGGPIARALGLDGGSRGSGNVTYKEELSIGTVAAKPCERCGAEARPRSQSEITKRAWERAYSYRPGKGWGR